MRLRQKMFIYQIITQKAIQVIPKQNHFLEVSFENGEMKMFDFKPYLIPILNL